MSDKQKKAFKKKVVEGREAETKAAVKEPAKRKTGQKEKKSGKGFVVLFIVIVVLLIGAGSAFCAPEPKIRKYPFRIPWKPWCSQVQLRHLRQRSLVTAYWKSLVQGGMSVEEAYHKRPEEKVLTDGNQSDFANIESCRIDTETGKD